MRPQTPGPCTIPLVADPQRAGSRGARDEPVRDRLRALGSALLVATALQACTSSDRPPHRELNRVWREYRAMDPARALAIAGDPREVRWVTAATGGHPDLESARAGALAQCAKSRQVRRIQAPCVLYAVGDQVVWEAN